MLVTGKAESYLVPLDEQANLAVQLAFRFQTYLDGDAAMLELL